jgi:DNA polymerase/3'-5' exonuclease PolX
VYAPEALPFALLYFTGSDYFNRSMRWWAKKKGISLNDEVGGRSVGSRV